MRTRFLALAVMLAVAATPAMAVMCELACEEPVREAPSCHSGAATLSDLAMHGGHACGELPCAASPAVLTPVSGGLTAPECSDVLSIVPRVMAVAASDTNAAGPTHGPPDSRYRTQRSLAAILRI